MDDNERPAGANGFEYGGRFYRWHVSDMGKDLMLIDRFSGLPVTEFFDLVDDEPGLERGPVLLTLIATSLRHGNPDWSVERITRTVMNLSLSEVEFVFADQDEPAEEEAMRPPPETVPATPPLDGAHSSSPRNGSSSSSIREESSGSETSYATPA